MVKLDRINVDDFLLAGRRNASRGSCMEKGRPGQSRRTALSHDVCPDPIVARQVTAYGGDVHPVQLITPHRHIDARGWFAEVYSVPTFAAAGIDCVFVQDNHSLSASAYTLRGLHFQVPPRGQAKLVRCVRGRVWDVAVDLRAGSPTYGRWVGTELSAENGCQLFVPVGFAHGFLTLEPDCEVVYKCSDVYAPAHDSGVRWSTVGIEWPVPAGIAPELSDKDRGLPELAGFASPFAYDGRPLGPLA